MEYAFRYKGREWTEAELVRNAYNEGLSAVLELAANVASAVQSRSSRKIDWAARDARVLATNKLAGIAEAANYLSTHITLSRSNTFSKNVQRAIIGATLATAILG